LQKAQETIARLKREVDEVNRIVPLVATPRTELREPKHGIDGWSVNVPHNGHRGGDLFHFINYAEDFGLENMISRVEGREQKVVANKLREHRKQISWAMLDVTGEKSTDGLLAALYLREITQGIPSYLEHRGYVPTDLLEIVNHLAYRGDNVKMTCFSFGDVRANPEENCATVRLISAGMPTPVVFRAATGDMDKELYEKWRPEGNVPLGLMPSEQYRDIRGNPDDAKPAYNIMKARLQPGDKLILGSDGLFEYGSLGNSDKTVALKKILEVARNNPSARASDLGAQIFDDMITGMKSIAHDDMTLAIIQYRGKGN
jgi:serine phosphatase RsbU (regulator of sigma subunit)